MSKQLVSLGRQIVYGTRVFGYLAREVAVKEQFGPPSLSELGQAQKELAQGIKTLRTLSFMNYTVGEVLGKLIQGFSVVSFFVVGEMVGRRSLIGYRY